MTGVIPQSLWDDGQLQHAGISLERIESAIDEMATQLAAAGASPVPVLRARYDLAVHRFGHAEAHGAFEAWAHSVADRNAADPAPIASAAAATIGALPWCPHCDLADQVEHIAAMGDPAQACTMATTLLDAAPRSLCQEQPAGLISAVLPSLLLTGQADRAAREHLLAVRLLETTDASPRMTRARAAQLLVCARTGRLQRGVDLLQEWFTWLPETTAAYARMQLSAAGARVLREVSDAGHGEVSLVLRDEPVTVEALGARLLAHARQLAVEFDARNQTQAATELVDDVLDAAELPDLPLDAVLRSPRSLRMPARRAEGQRGRRARAAGSGPPIDDLSALVSQFDAALAADSEPRRSAVLAKWRAIRALHELDVGPDGQDAARLDGWLAIERLSGASAPAAAHEELIEQAEAATRRLRLAGLPLDSLLHEQAALLAAAQNGVTQAAVVERRISAIADQIASLDSPADLGLAWSRVALIRELVAANPVDDAELPPSDAQTDAVELGLVALQSIPASELNHQQARALCRLLRLHAGDEEPAAAAGTLERAVAVLPDGVRPMERALARADLATLVQETDPAAAAAMWHGSISDAALAGAEPLLASLLAAGAGVRRAVGDVDGAIGDLTQAVPLLDRFAPPELAAQARFDLARALIDGERYIEAATAAESALADLTDLMTTPSSEPDGPGAAADPALAHVAGCAAFAASEAIAASGDVRQARVLAELSAGWHEANGNLVAEAEAWQLAARIGGPARQVASDLERAAELAEAGGEWSRAASCRRDRASAVRDADGVDAALEVLDEAEKALVARESHAGRHVSAQDARDAMAAARLMTWHRLALCEQRARMLAVAGRFGDALVAVDGLEDGYLELGDAWSARDLLGLRGQLRAEVGNVPGGVLDLERAAAQAITASDTLQARGLGERLAMVLDRAGRHADAEQAYQRFCTQQD